MPCGRTSASVLFVRRVDRGARPSITLDLRVTSYYSSFIFYCVYLDGVGRASSSEKAIAASFNIPDSIMSLTARRYLACMIIQMSGSASWSVT